MGGWEEPLLEGRYNAFSLGLITGSNVNGAVAAGKEVGGFYADTGGAAVLGVGVLAVGILGDGGGDVVNRRHTQ